MGERRYFDSEDKIPLNTRKELKRLYADIERLRALTQSQKEEIGALRRLGRKENTEAADSYLAALKVARMADGRDDGLYLSTAPESEAT